MAYDLTKDSLTMGSGIQPVRLKIGGIDLIEIFPLQYSNAQPVALLGSPSELGKMRYDHKIIKPKKISFSGLMKKAHFAKVKNLIEKAVRSFDPNGFLFCIFYSKAGTAMRMMIEQFDETGNNQRLDAVEVKVSLSEFLEHGKTNK